MTIKVYYIIPGMDSEYDVVFRHVSPELTVEALAAKIKDEWADEEDADEDWVGRSQRQWLLPTMTMGQLREQCPAGKKLKIKYVPRSAYERHVAEHESTARQQLVRTRSVSGERTTNSINSMMNVTKATRATSSTDMIVSGDDRVVYK
jgi:ribosomal protein L35